MVRNITSTLSVLFLGIASAITTEAATVLKPAMRGCPSSGYSRLVNVSAASQLPSALSSAQPGDQIRLAAGTYASTSFSGKGTASAPITICGVRGTWPIIKGGTFKISGVSNVNITGIIFEGGGQNNVVGLMNSSNVHFTYNEVRYGLWHAGIAVDSNSNIEISYNNIHHNGDANRSDGYKDHGIYFRNQTGSNVIANNLIHNNVGRGISMHSNDGSPVENATVVHNTIFRNGGAGILVAVNGGKNNIIANNITADNSINPDKGDKQIRIKPGACSCATTGNTIANNIVWSPVAGETGINEEQTGNTVVNNRAVDPQFVSNYSDLRLRSSSPAIGLANPTYATNIDLDDYLRDSSPDAGAFEAGGNPAPTPMPTPEPTPAPTPAPMPVPSLKELRIPVAADAFVNSAYPTTNRGSKSFLKVGNSPQTHTLLKFTVSGVAGAAVQSVKLRLVPNASSTSGGELRRVLSNSWTETGVTWNSAPAAGATVLARQGATTKGKVIELDVTAEVKADGTYSFELSTSVADGVEYDYYSREAGTSVQPELVITLAP